MTKLTLPTVLTAMVKSASNAADLAEDANVLLGAGRHARAFMLLHCAAEELAKYFMLEVLARKMALKAPINWARFWKRIRSHDSKMAHAAVRLEALSALIAPANLDAARAGSQIWSHAGIVPRNHALYVEIEEGKIRAPSDINWSIGVEGLQGLVQVLLEGARAIGTTENEITNSLQGGPQGDFLAPYLLQLRQWREAGLSKAEATERVNKIWALTTNTRTATATSGLSSPLTNLRGLVTAKLRFSGSAPTSVSGATPQSRLPSNISGRVGSYDWCGTRL